MSNKRRVNKKRRRSPWYNIFAKKETRLSARLTREEDWQTDVPQIRLSRAFVVVLVMHFVVIGSVVAFMTLSPDAGKAQAKADDKKKAKSVEKPTPKSSDKRGTKTNPVSSDTTRRSVVTDKSNSGRFDDMRRHIVHSGDDVAKIAEQYGVTSEEIHAVNRIDELYQLYQGRVLRIPVSASEPIRVPGTAIADGNKPSGTNSNLVTDKPNPDIPRAEAVKPADDDIETPAETNKIDESAVAEAAKEDKRPVVVEEEKKPRVEREIKSGGDKDTDTTEIVRPSAEDLRRLAEAREEAKKRLAARSGRTYKVVKGDNPFRIAKRHGIHYKDLLSYNGITDPSKLQIGQVLKIPNK